MLVVGLDELGVLLLDLLGVLPGQGEQHVLQMAVQVLPGLRGDLRVGDPGLQVPDERGSGRRQRPGLGRGCGRGPSLRRNGRPYRAAGKRPLSLAAGPAAR